MAEATPDLKDDAEETLETIEQQAKLGQENQEPMNAALANIFSGIAFIFVNLKLTVLYF